MKKLTLKQATSLFNNGKKIYLKPSKLSVQVMEHSPWFSWCVVQINQDENDFRKAVNAFSYYNCNKEAGLRVNYYAYIN